MFFIFVCLASNRIKMPTYPYISLHTAYNSQPTMQLEVAINSRMFSLAIGGIDLAAPSLDMVIYPGGSRRYGAYFPNCPFKPPFREDMGRLDDIEATGIFYYAFEDWLEERKKEKVRRWDWVQVVPDAIVSSCCTVLSYGITLPDVY